MTYNIFIDQKFAIVHGLTIVQATTLAACMTLTLWSNSIKLGNVVWYQYSEKEMSDNFPFLFFLSLKELTRTLEFCLIWVLSN